MIILVNVCNITPQATTKPILKTTAKYADTLENSTYMWTSRREDEFSSFFRSSPVLKYPPVFSWLLQVPPVFSWLLHVHVPNVQFAPCAFRPRKQDAIWMTYLWYFESLHSAEVFYSHFKICFNNFIYPPWVDYFTLGWWLFEYLLASTVNFKIYIFKIN